METRIIKPIFMVLLITSSVKMKAQKDLPFLGSVNASPPGKSSEEKIKISEFAPNPTATGSSIIKIDCTVPVNLKVRIFTLGGSLKEEEYYSMDKGMTELYINLDFLPDGIYLVQFCSKEWKTVRKFIKSG